MSAQPTEERIIEAMVTLLESGVGYAIDFFGGMLTLQLDEGGAYRVTHTAYDPGTGRTHYLCEEEFADARQAAEFFERKRREQRIGFDFERA